MDESKFINLSQHPKNRGSKHKVSKKDELGRQEERRGGYPEEQKSDRDKKENKKPQRK